MYSLINILFFRSNSDSKLIFNEFYLQFNQTNVIFIGIIFGDTFKVKLNGNIPYLLTIIERSNITIEVKLNLFYNGNLLFFFRIAA